MPGMPQLKADDVAQRLGSIKRLSTIALALGDERTRKELVPFLNASSEDDDEARALLASRDLHLPRSPTWHSLHAPAQQVPPAPARPGSGAAVAPSPHEP